MSKTNQKEGKDHTQYTLNLALAGVVSQVGCLTTIIVIVALFIGLLIDSRLDTRPTFTILLVVLSVPFTLFAMFWVVRNITSRMKTVADTDNDPLQEEGDRGPDE
jgi:F0F1-type ATP synthase assembly protein I